MNRTKTEEERLRKLRQVSVGIAPQGMPGVPGQPSRPAPAGGIAPVASGQGAGGSGQAGGIVDGPKLFVDSDGRARAGFDLSSQGAATGLVPADARGVPLGTTMVPVRGLSQGYAMVGRPVDGALPPAPVDLTRADDPALRHGIAGSWNVQPGAPATQLQVGIAPPASSQQPASSPPVAGGLFPDRAAERQRQHDLAMDRSRYGLQRGGATSAAGREFDASRAAAADAARRMTLVQGQQTIQREGQQLAAQSLRDKAAIEGAAGLMGKHIEGQTARDVAAIEAEMELTKAEREAAARREERLQNAALKQEEWTQRYGQDRNQIPDIELNNYVKDDAPAIREYRAANSKTYDADPAKNEQKRLEEVRKVARKHYGSAGTGGWWSNKVSSRQTEAQAADELLKELEDTYGPFVDMLDQRFRRRDGASAGGATAGRGAAASGQPGGQWEIRD